MKTLPYLFVVLSVFSSCTTSHKRYDKCLEQTFLTTPDSLLTTEQIATKIKVYDFLMANVTAENKREKLPVSRKQMLSCDIPEVYYDILQYEVRNNNRYVRKAMKEGLFTKDDFDMESKLKESKERWWNTERPALVQRLGE